jgi:hypothetical protein
MLRDYRLFIDRWFGTQSLEHVALRFGRWQEWNAVLRESGVQGLMFLCLNSLRMYNLKVYVREISGMYRLYVCMCLAPNLSNMLR